MNYNYDLIILGGGPAGYTGAIRASKLGLKTALIEKSHLGGTCLNRGCIPTKALLHSAEIFDSRNEWEELGIFAQNVTISQEKIYAHKDKIVSSLRDGIKMLIKAGNIDLYEGNGEFLDQNTIAINLADQTTQITAKHILIATGSSPSGFNPDRPINGIENALNSDHILAQPIADNNIAILGGGVIAVEFAVYFASIGKSVTMIISGDRLLKNMPKDIATSLSMALKRKKVSIITSATIEQVTKNSVTYSKDGQSKEVIATPVSALGRTPNLKGIGLNKIGLDENAKCIKVDQNMFTGIGSIYASGDVTGKIQLAHFASASAITAVESMLNLPHTINLNVCPSCVYTTPEIAIVGKSESEVENAKVGKFMMGANGKSTIEGVRNGYIKVIADANDVLVGAEVFAVRGTDLIGELALAISKGLKAEEVASVIHPHPTIMEAVGESLEDIFGLATHIIKR